MGDSTIDARGAYAGPVTAATKIPMCDPGADGYAGTVSQLAAFLAAAKRLQVLTAANDASLIDTTSLTDAYRAYLFRFFNIVPSVAGSLLYFQVSTDSGATWKSDANYYGTGLGYTSGAASSSPYADKTIAASNGYVNSGGSNAANDGGMSGFMLLMAPSAVGYKQFMLDTMGFGSAWDVASLDRFIGAVQYRGSTAAIDGIKFFESTGTVNTGVIETWGIP